MFTPADPPKRHDYVAAINAIRDELGERDLDVLRFQFQSPGRSVTSQDIRDHFSYGGIGASNLLYGKLGNKFATALPMETEPKGSARTRYWKSLSTGDGTGEHFIWIMRPELANALIETGIVQPETDGLALVPDVDIHASTFSAVEGRRKLVIHLVRERNRELVKQKKTSVDIPKCEACGFCFVEYYGDDYCEVHHLTPLADLTEDTETTLDDLAIVCANCHRIVHLQFPPLSIAELRSKIERHRK
ncbi:HNH endonuclease [Sphaerothrix gracilis]|uniref:HNH endonuclease n=1 Tax=Sphaerothrix gracilis TaxID=3151835 RepID=UPI0031FC8FC1